MSGKKHSGQQRVSHQRSQREQWRRLNLIGNDTAEENETPEDTEVERAEETDEETAEKTVNMTVEMGKKWRTVIRLSHQNKQVYTGFLSTGEYHKKRVLTIFPLPAG